MVAPVPRSSAGKGGHLARSVTDASVDADRHVAIAALPVRRPQTPLVIPVEVPDICDSPSTLFPASRVLRTVAVPDSAGLQYRGDEAHRWANAMAVASA